MHSPRFLAVITGTVLAILTVTVLLWPSEDRASAGVPLYGDANCDSTVNAIDSLFILQFNAGLLSTLACEPLADVNGDGNVNSLDAALVLQFDAGLIGSLGPTSPAPTSTPQPPAPTTTPTSPPATTPSTSVPPTATPLLSTATPTSTQLDSPTNTPTATTTPIGTSTPTTGLYCDPAYPTVCIPPPPPDLNCADIPYTDFVVLPPDPHGFDGDQDGVGCET